MQTLTHNAPSAFGKIQLHNQTWRLETLPDQPATYKQKHAANRQLKRNKHRLVPFEPHWPTWPLEAKMWTNGPVFTCTRCWKFGPYNTSVGNCVKRPLHNFHKLDSKGQERTGPIVGHHGGKSQPQPKIYAWLSKALGPILVLKDAKEMKRSLSLSRRWTLKGPQELGVHWNIAKTRKCSCFKTRLSPQPNSQPSKKPRPGKISERIGGPVKPTSVVEDLEAAYLFC